MFRVLQFYVLVVRGDQFFVGDDVRWRKKPRAADGDAMHSSLSPELFVY